MPSIATTETETGQKSIVREKRVDTHDGMEYNTVLLIFIQPNYVQNALADNEVPRLGVKHQNLVDTSHCSQ